MNLSLRKRRLNTLFFFVAFVERKKEFFLFREKKKI